MPEPAATQRAVFLSYASEDAPTARRIAEGLARAGLEVWFDQSELRGGDAWDQKIRRQIKECALFMPVISSHTQSRAEGYFRLEWHLAEQRTYLMAHDRPFIVPVVVDDTPDAAARVPDRFRERQWTRLHAGECTPEFGSLVLRLSGAHADEGARHAPTGGPAPAAPTAEERSVAVLPFANLSGDKENEYFSDGVSDELLNVLQQIPGLRVAARTSSFSFKGKTSTVQEIGSRLGVANLVEGSAQKAGNRVKITARLNRVATGEMRWSKSYTREIQDVFALQEELALAIVGELRGHFAMESGGVASAVHKAAQTGTRDTSAYQHYLLGKHQLNLFSDESTQKALAEFTRAVTMDPGFTLGWSGLASAHLWFAGYSGRISRTQFDEHLVQGRAAIERALALNPSLAQAVGILFWLEFAFEFNWAKAEALIDRARALAPNDPDVLTMSSRFLMAKGETRLALEEAERAVALDPLNSKVRVQLSLGYMVERRFDEARREAAMAAELSPNGIFSKSGSAFILMAEKRYDEALAIVDPASTNWSVLWVRAITSYHLGRKDESDTALNRLIHECGDTAAIQIACAYSERNEVDRAFEWLERARVQRDPGLSMFVRSPFMSNLRPDPRWGAFWRKMGVQG
jgi:TolB-like protein